MSGWKRVREWKAIRPMSAGTVYRQIAPMRFITYIIVPYRVVVPNPAYAAESLDKGI
jgi:hypothetical protein